MNHNLGVTGNIAAAVAVMTMVTAVSVGVAGLTFAPGLVLVDGLVFAAWVVLVIGVFGFAAATGGVLRV